MLVKKSVLLAKIEATYNTDPVPVAATDAVKVENLSHGPASQKMVEQATVKNTLGKEKSLFGTTLWQVSFDVLVKGSGAAGTAPEYGPLLRACALGETIVASTSVTYAPVSTGFESVTLYVYEDGKLYKVTGCAGNVAFAGEAGGAGKLTFTMTGHKSAITDTALAAPTLDTTEAPMIKSAGFTIDSYAASISALNFDMGNQVVMPMDINAPDGFGEIQVTDRDINGTIDPEDQLIATKDFISDWESGTEMPLTTGVIGGTAGNRFQISMPAVSYRDASLGDRDGIRTMELPYGAHEVTGDDGVSIAFT